ncbi:hypothetical protein HMPREF1870_02699 [Bacteroidales bacterium KA00344]|nr:hypothetical protein HMPREF1870_02699 [Bacteroidales bacterium KA00344]
MRLFTINNIGIQVYLYKDQEFFQWQCRNQTTWKGTFGAPNFYIQKATRCFVNRQKQKSRTYAPDFRIMSTSHPAA